MDPVTIELSCKLDEMAKHEDINGPQGLFNELKVKTEALAGELQNLKSEFTS